jgi:hypothetical protein
VREAHPARERVCTSTWICTYTFDP